MIFVSGIELLGVYRFRSLRNVSAVVRDHLTLPSNRGPEVHSLYCPGRIRSHGFLLVAGRADEKTDAPERENAGGPANWSENIDSNLYRGPTESDA